MHPITPRCRPCPCDAPCVSTRACASWPFSTHPAWLLHAVTPCHIHLCHPRCTHPLSWAVPRPLCMCLAHVLVPHMPRCDPSTVCVHVPASRGMFRCLTLVIHFTLHPLSSRGAAMTPRLPVCPHHTRLSVPTVPHPWSVHASPCFLTTPCLCTRISPWTTILESFK